MDVGEMLPGHLRLYALARCTSLVKKSLIYSMTRAKNERNNASEQIKEGIHKHHAAATIIHPGIHNTLKA